MTALITGSSKGIGFAIAEAFANKGYNIILNGKSDVKGLDTAVDEIKKKADVIGILADISVPEDVSRLINEGIKKFGSVDVLVNNAGMDYFGMFQDMTFAEIHENISNNLMSALYTTKEALSTILFPKISVVINVTSIWGVTGASCEVAYSAAKAGIIGFTKALAKELGPAGTRVNAVACGLINTRMNNRMDESEKNEFLKKVPLRRMGEPEEVAAAVVFLASDAARYITGQVLCIDGGYCNGF